MPEGDQANVYTSLFQKMLILSAYMYQTEILSRGLGVGIAVSKIWPGFQPDNCHSLSKPHVHTNVTSLLFIFHRMFVADPGLV